VFNIQAMKITVIDITPGCIGMPRVPPSTRVPSAVVCRSPSTAARAGGSVRPPTALVAMWFGAGCTPRVRRSTRPPSEAASRSPSTAGRVGRAIQRLAGWPAMKSMGCGSLSMGARAGGIIRQRTDWQATLSGAYTRNEEEDKENALQLLSRRVPQLDVQAGHVDIRDRETGPLRKARKPTWYL
jgi:hypothetical protein